MKKTLTVENLKPEIVKKRGNLASVARSFGVTRQAVHDYVKNNDLQEFVDEEREKKLDEAEDILWGKVQEGATPELLFFLKTQGRKRGYIERQEIEQTGNITLTVVYGDDGTNDTST